MSRTISGLGLRDAMQRNNVVGANGVFISDNNPEQQTSAFKLDTKNDYTSDVENLKYIFSVSNQGQIDLFSVASFSLFDVSCSGFFLKTLEQQSIAGMLTTRALDTDTIIYGFLNTDATISTMKNTEVEGIIIGNLFGLPKIEVGTKVSDEAEYDISISAKKGIQIKTENFEVFRFFNSRGMLDVLSEINLTSAPKINFYVDENLNKVSYIEYYSDTFNFRNDSYSTNGKFRFLSNLSTGLTDFMVWDIVLNENDFENILKVLIDENEVFKITKTGNIHASSCILAGAGNYLKVPTMTTAQRPANPEAGMIIFNTTTGEFEGYDGSSWVRLS